MACQAHIALRFLLVLVLVTSFVYRCHGRVKHLFTGLKGTRWSCLSRGSWVYWRPRFPGMRQHIIGSWLYYSRGRLRSLAPRGQNLFCEGRGRGAKCFAQQQRGANFFSHELREARKKWQPPIIDRQPPSPPKLYLLYIKIALFSAEGLCNNITEWAEYSNVVLADMSSSYKVLEKAQCVYKCLQWV